MSDGLLPRRRSTTVAAGAARGLERRFQLANAVRRSINKVFPEHFSFLWGEIALYSFVVLLLSGTFLTFFYVPSLDEVTYRGSFAPVYGLDASRAYVSVLDLSVDVRGGLWVRQIHHWAALIFLAAIMLHMCRIFFTGAYRAPRETNWFLGVAMLVISIFEGYLGYSMLDDLLSGTGVRIFSGIILSVPVFGTWLHWMVFESEFPGEIYVERFYIAHVLILPGLLLALIGLHLAFVWYQKHTQFPGPRAREENVVGNRTMPVFAVHSVSMLLGTTGVIGLLAGAAQINPIFHWGPYNPVHVSNGSEPDWYASFLIGSLRLFPPADISVFGRYTIPAGFWAGVVLPLVMILLLFMWPVIDRRRTRDRELHNLLDRPRDDPERTGVGALGLTFYAVLFVAGGDDIITYAFGLNVNVVVWTARVLVFVAPPLAYWATRRWCLALQREDRDVLARGVLTGVLTRRTDGTYDEVRQPVVGTDDRHDELPPVYGGARLPRTPVAPASPSLAAQGAPASRVDPTDGDRRDG